MNGGFRNSWKDKKHTIIRRLWKRQTSSGWGVASEPFRWEVMNPLFREHLRRAFSLQYYPRLSHTENKPDPVPDRGGAPKSKQKSSAQREHREENTSRTCVKQKAPQIGENCAISTSILQTKRAWKEEQPHDKVITPKYRRTSTTIGRHQCLAWVAANILLCSMPHFSIVRCPLYPTNDKCDAARV